MKTYLVGGAVRDKQLQRPVVERDWVVVGASPEDMLRKGFRQVGRDFPVFLHPKTGEEYALARRERKTGPGYAGFAFDTSPEVTLEEDLLRRDLTINAMAEAPDGTLVDPFGGLRDLKDRWLRHVSLAFSEDPVRILRVARFAARFAGLGFRVAPETLTLMRVMVTTGEVDALVAERVWKELERALAEAHPEVFFEVLVACGALPRLFPEEMLQGLQALQRAVQSAADPVIRFAALTHALSQAAIHQMCQRLRVPNDFQELAILVSRYLPQYQTVFSEDAAEIVQLLQHVDAFRREERFEKWLLACAACLPELDSVTRLRKCFHSARQVDASALALGAKGAEIADRIRAARVRCVEDCLRQGLP